jgi:hypothetical protein
MPIAVRAVSMGVMAPNPFVAPRAASAGRRTQPAMPGTAIALSTPPLGVWVAMAALVSALVLGGGGTSNPTTELVLHPLMALLVALPLINSRLAEGLWRPVPRLAWAMAALVLVVPMAQLVPLPPALWQSLPGRAAEMQSLALIGGIRAGCRGRLHRRARSSRLSPWFARCWRCCCLPGSVRHIGCGWWWPW